MVWLGDQPECFPRGQIGGGGDRVGETESRCADEGFVLLLVSLHMRWAL